MIDLLEEQIGKLQKEYLAILKMVSEKINTETYQCVVDEILVFWQKHKRVALNIATYYITPMTTMAFTGATFLDVEDFEHYPFLAIGDKHILDDPLCKYLEISSRIQDGNMSETLYEQCLLTLNDNIKVIENCFPHIIILPLRYLYDTDNEILHKGAMDAFLSMFNDRVNSLTDYKRLKTIEEINDSLLPEVVSRIVFDIDEDNSIDLISRFNNFSSNNKMYSNFKNDANQLFFLTIIGYLSQALSIILMCAACQCIPYVRYGVAFKYMVMLSGNFVKIPGMQEMIFKSSVAHVLYHIFDKNDFKEIEFSDYVELLAKKNIKDKMFDRLDEYKLNMQTADLKSIESVVKSFLGSLG